MMATHTHSGIIAPPIWQTDPARMRRIAIIQGERLVIAEQDLAGHVSQERELEAWHPMAMLGECLGAKCSAVWICPPHTRDWLQVCRQLIEDPPDWLRAHGLSQRKGAALYGMILQSQRGGMPVGVYVVDAGDMWAIEDASRAAVPMATASGLFLAMRLLGMQLRFSPSYTGLQMLRQELAAKHAQIPPLTEATRELVRRYRPTYVHWSRPISLASGATGLLLHKYDRNASFVASAGEVPVGEPVHVETYMPKHPGIYRVRAWMTGDHVSDTDRWTLPGFFHVGPRAGHYPWGILDDLWVWEPQLRLALAYGVNVHVQEGWAWPEKHDLFRSWRDRVWRAELAAKQVPGPIGQVARAVIKRCSRAAIGRLTQQIGHAVLPTAEAEAKGLRVLSREIGDDFEFTGFADVQDELGKQDLARPDWWGQIIANANERLMSAIYQHHAWQPVAGYVDAAYCLGAWQPHELEPERLGRWKHEWTIGLSAQDVTAWNELVTGARAKPTERDENHTGEAIKLLAAIARRSGYVTDESADGGADDGEGEAAE